MRDYYWNLSVSWILRCTFWLLLTLSVLAFASCASKGIQGTVNGTVVDPAIELGRSSSDRTGNPTPQGGSDEKSYSTPTKPSD